MHLLRHLQTAVEVGSVGKVFGLLRGIFVVDMGGGSGPAVAEVLRTQGVADVDAIEKRIEGRAAAVVGELQRVEERLGGVGELRGDGGVGGGQDVATPTSPLGGWGRCYREVQDGVGVVEQQGVVQVVAQRREQHQLLRVVQQWADGSSCCCGCADRSSCRWDGQGQWHCPVGVAALWGQRATGVGLTITTTTTTTITITTAVTIDFECQPHALAHVDGGGGGEGQPAVQIKHVLRNHTAG